MLSNSLSDKNDIVYGAGAAQPLWLLCYAALILKHVNLSAVYATAAINGTSYMPQLPCHWVHDFLVGVHDLHCYQESTALITRVTWNIDETQCLSHAQE